MSTVFIDETGYTGTDLLNSAQPVFVLVSHDFDEQDAMKLKERFFGGVRAKELKYSQMRSRPTQQAMVLAFLEFLAGEQKRIKFIYCHKEFCVVTKMVDLIVEPSMYESGFDLYARGGNIALSNVTYYVTLSLGGRVYFDSLLKAFQGFFRSPTPETLRVVEELLESKTGLRGTATDAPEGLREILRCFHLPILGITIDDLRVLSTDGLDICMAFAFCLMSGWAKEHGHELTLVHDASSSMSKNKEVWSKVVSPDVPQARVGRDRRTFEFPLRVRETKIERSVDWAGLQLADVIAGAIAEVLRTAETAFSGKPEYVKALGAIIGQWQCENSIWPTPKVTPAELGTTGDFNEDPIEHIMKIIRGG